MGLLRFLSRALLVFVGLVLIAAIGGWFWLKGATVPQHSGRLALKGLMAPVQIEREASGITHIKALNEHDLHFALGVAHAQDRLWQMEFRRRIGAGRLSEVIGKATLGQDKFLRTWGFYRAAEQAYSNLSPEGKAVMDAYVQGVNAYLATNPALPLEFRLLRFRPQPWTPADVLVWSKMMSYDLSGNWESELERFKQTAAGMSEARMYQLRPIYPKTATTIVQPQDVRLPPSPKPQPSAPEPAPATPPRAQKDANQAVEASALLKLSNELPQMLSWPKEIKARASNNWVIAGSRTTTGKPLLANDPHLGLEAPTIWYLAHLEAPGYKAIGATLPGLPGVVVGRNERIAWGVTTVGADVQDLYVLDEVPGGYRYKGGVEAFKMRDEVIKVKGEPDVVLKVRESRYGPVINDVVKVAGTKPVSLRWTSLDPSDRTLEAFVGVGKAKNWAEFTQALLLYSAPSQNFVYADVEGNIGYMAPARFPVRKPGHNGQKPMPGDGNWDWLGYLPQSLWPQVYNPKEGFIVTANNKAVPANYPYLISLEWEEPYRAERVRQLIEAKPKLSPEDMVAMQQDLTSLLWREFRPVLQVLSPVSERSREWRERLLKWDGVMRADQTEPSVFQAWYSELSRLPAKEVGRDFWEEPRYLLWAMQQGDPGCKQDGMQNCLEYAALALDKAIDRFGDSVPVWGQAHQAAFTHRILNEVPILKNLANRSVPIGGDRYTLNRASYDPATFALTSHSSYRHIIDFSDLENSRFIYPMGQSGAVMSNQYGNLLPLWQKGQYLPMKMQGYSVAERQVLEPGR